MTRLEKNYHVEITKLWSDLSELKVYVLRIDNLEDKLFFSIASPFNKQPPTSSFVHKYIEENLDLNWKNDSDKNRIEFLSINYSPSLLMKHTVNEEMWKSTESFPFIQNSVSYLVSVNGPKAGKVGAEISRQVFIRCEERNNPGNYCLLTLSSLDTGSISLEKFMSNNLIIETN